jgi:hypothetical protein
MTQPPKSPVIRFVANSATIVVGAAAAAYAPRELDGHSFGPEDIASMSAAFEG